MLHFTLSITVSQIFHHLFVFLWANERLPFLVQWNKELKCIPLAAHFFFIFISFPLLISFRSTKVEPIVSVGQIEKLLVFYSKNLTKEFLLPFRFSHATLSFGFQWKKRNHEFLLQFCGLLKRRWDRILFRSLGAHMEGESLHAK